MGERGLALELTLVTALRQGEVKQLRVRDVDGDILWVGEEQPKTEDARRAIDLPPDLARRLGALVEGREPGGLVLPAKDGKRHTKTWLLRICRVACDRAGVPRMSPHDLWRTHAKLARRRGQTAAAVAAQLGHHRQRVTVETYVGKDVNAAAEAAEVWTMLRDTSRESGVSREDDRLWN